MLGMKTQEPTTITIPILCRFWEEDSSWNGSADHLPIAVCGATFEEARDNLRDAITGHFQTVGDIGDIGELLEQLKRRAHEYGFLSPADLPPQSTFVPMQAALRDHKLLALT